LRHGAIATPTGRVVRAFRGARPTHVKRKAIPPMRTLARLVLAGLAAAVLLCSYLAPASARSFSIENRNIRAVWRELTFEQKRESEPAVGQIRCHVTMEGSFHESTIAKVAGALIGVITRAIVAHPCREVGGRNSGSTTTPKKC
jgi:hypothetical protein